MENGAKKFVDNFGPAKNRKQRSSCCCFFCMKIRYWPNDRTNAQHASQYTGTRCVINIHQDLDFSQRVICRAMAREHVNYRFAKLFSHLISARPGNQGEWNDRIRRLMAGELTLISVWFKIEFLLCAVCGCVSQMDRIHLRFDFNSSKMTNDKMMCASCSGPPSTF